MSSDNRDELESALCLGDPGETVSLDTIKAMARAVRDAGYARPKHEHAFAPLVGTRGEETDGISRHVFWYERCGCGVTQARHWTTQIVKGEA